MLRTIHFSFCSQCGGKVRSDNSFCGLCGTPIPIFNEKRVEQHAQGKSKGKSWLFAFALAIMSWIYLSPYLAIWNLKEAARTENIAALSEDIDFPAFRASLKSELNGQLAQESSHDTIGEDAGFAALGSAFAGALVGVVIDQIATPQGIAKLVQGRKNIWNDVDPLTLWVGTNSVSTGYESLDRFDVRLFQPDNREPVLLIWRRSGFINWRFSEVRMRN